MHNVANIRLSCPLAIVNGTKNNWKIDMEQFYKCEINIEISNEN